MGEQHPGSVKGVLWRGAGGGTGRPTGFCSGVSRSSGTRRSGQNSYVGQILANVFPSGIASSTSKGALPSGEARRLLPGVRVPDEQAASQSVGREV